MVCRFHGCCHREPSKRRCRLKYAKWMEAKSKYLQSLMNSRLPAAIVLMVLLENRTLAGFQMKRHHEDKSQWRTMEGRSEHHSGCGGELQPAGVLEASCAEGEANLLEDQYFQ